MSLVESGWALSLEGRLLVSLAGSLVSLVGPLPDPPPWGHERGSVIPPVNTMWRLKPGLSWENQEYLRPCVDVK